MDIHRFHGKTPPVVIRYLDAHNHLQDPGLVPHYPAIWRDLQAIGLARAVVNGTSEADWDQVAALAREHRWVLPCYGVHPWQTKSRTPNWKERLTALIADGPCGIGEIGLDRWIKDFDIEDQQEVFVWQLALAAERNLAVSIHCLKAWGILWDIIREHPLPPCGFLLHAYGGPLEMLDGFIRRGAYFSFPGYFLDARKTERQEVFRQIPAERLLVETDAPSMPLPTEWTRYPLPASPDGHAVNHPASIAASYEGLAHLRDCTVENLADQVSENFQRLFGITP